MFPKVLTLEPKVFSNPLLQAIYRLRETSRENDESEPFLSAAVEELFAAT